MGVERRMTAPPILVTGSHRSGTTWVGRTLEASGGLGYIDEPFSILHRPGVLGARFDAWFPYITTDPGGRLTASVGQMLEFRYDPARELRAVRSPRDVGRMVRDTRRFGDYRRRHARPLVKDPVALLAAPWLASSFGMDVVVMIRHPAAFASSLKRMGWTHPFGDFLAQPALMDGPLAGYRDQVERYAAHPPDVIDQAGLLWTMLHDVIDGYRSAYPDWLFVRHEDLSTDPQAGFQRICDQLGLRYDGALERRLLRDTDAANPVEAVNGTAHVLQRDSRANIATWRTRLTAEEIERVRAATAAVSPRFYGEDEW
jgi:hypothetical protein